MKITFLIWCLSFALLYGEDVNAVKPIPASLSTDKNFYTPLDTPIVICTFENDTPNNLSIIRDIGELENRDDLLFNCYPYIKFQVEKDGKLHHLVNERSEADTAPGYIYYVTLKPGEKVTLFIQFKELFNFKFIKEYFYEKKTEPDGTVIDKFKGSKWHRSSKDYMWLGKCRLSFLASPYEKNAPTFFTVIPEVPKNSALLPPSPEMIDEKQFKSIKKTLVTQVYQGRKITPDESLGLLLAVYQTGRKDWLWESIQSCSDNYAVIMLLEYLDGQWLDKDKLLKLLESKDLAVRWAALRTFMRYGKDKPMAAFLTEWSKTQQDKPTQKLALKAAFYFNGYDKPLQAKPYRDGKPIKDFKPVPVSLTGKSASG